MKPLKKFVLFIKLDDKKASKETRGLIPTACRTPVQKVQQLQLLNGKLRSSLRRLYALQREKAKL
jgi:hypothetical protein